MDVTLNNLCMEVTTALVIKFWNFENSLKSSERSSTHKLPHKLLSHLRLSKFGNTREISNCGEDITWCSSLPSRNELWQ